jgi:hypothetical protein
MNRIAKPAMLLGLAGILAVASMTPSEARVNRWAAAGIGLAVGALIGSAAANANSYYYGPGYGYGYDGPYYAYQPAYGPDYAYQPAPAYAYQPAPMYVAPAYGYRAPTYAADPAYAYTGDPSYAAYNSAYGYNRNAVVPWQEHRLRGTDY